MLVSAASRFSSALTRALLVSRHRRSGVFFSFFFSPHKIKRTGCRCCAGLQPAQLQYLNPAPRTSARFRRSLFSSHETSRSDSFCARAYLFTNFHVPLRSNPRVSPRVFRLAKFVGFLFFTPRTATREMPKVGTGIGQRRTASIVYREEPQRQRSTGTALTLRRLVVASLYRFSFAHFDVFAARALRSGT